VSRSGPRPSLTRRVALQLGASLLHLACGHAPRVVRSDAIASCPGVSADPLEQPTWIAAADIDGDGDGDLLLLDVDAGPAETTRVSVVPLRRAGAGYCQDARIAVWTGFSAAPWARAPGDPRLLPRLTRLAAYDLDEDTRVDLVVWNPGTFDVAVLRGTGAPDRPFGAAERPLAPRIDDAPILPAPSSAPRDAHELDVDDVDGDGRRDLVLHVEPGTSGVFYAGRDDGGHDAGRFFGAVPQLDLREPSVVSLRYRRSAERHDSVVTGAGGRVHLTRGDLHVAAEHGGWLAGGRFRVPAPFAADYAVYLDLTGHDTYGLKTLVVGAGRRLALQPDRTAPNRWHVLRLP
jgi:hypothetical protein